MVNISYYGALFEKYQITHILINRNTKVANFIRNIDSAKYKKLYGDYTFEIYEVLEY